MLIQNQNPTKKENSNSLKALIYNIYFTWLFVSSDGNFVNIEWHDVKYSLTWGSIGFSVENIDGDGVANETNQTNDSKN